ncbi:MAG TPA: DUF3108 domain-containing protein [Ideonella sp.]|nr:DUF3108 domain-containing protein [Ideonella sp.]
MPGRRLTPPLARRRAGWCALLLAVCAVHWWVAERLPDSRFGEGAAEDDSPKAIEVAFVRELAPAAPPVLLATAAPPPRAARRVKATVVPEPPASAPSSPASDAAAVALADAASSAASHPVSAADAASMAASAAADIAAVAMPPASAVTAPPVAAAASAPSVLAFDWPPSTRLIYTLVGNYRGPLNGTAKVEWLREGSRYQVRLEVTVAFVLTRRMLSDGLLGPQGLMPRRYDEETEIPLRETRRQTVHFEPDRIALANGKINDPVPGAQDTASQFVQMTWLFLSKPELLQVGKTVEFPLALPRRVGLWTYDVTEQVDLPLPFGEVKTFHLVPRPASKRANEMVVEMWMAPSLQSLPVKITIRQDAESYVELTLKSAPLQAASPTASEPKRIVR